jgi:hypothetical protein
MQAPGIARPLFSTCVTFAGLPRHSPRMKKFLTLCTAMFGLATTGLLAEDAVVSLPAPASPPPPPVSTTGSGTSDTGKKHSGKGHKHGHKHKSDGIPTTPPKP